MKKFISMVMAAAMVVSLVPATAFAADVAAIKVVGDKEITKDEAKAGNNANGEYYVKGAQIQIALQDVDVTTASNDKIELTLDLEGMELDVSSDKTNFDFGGYVLRSKTVDGNVMGSDVVPNVTVRADFLEDEATSFDVTIAEQAGGALLPGDVIVLTTALDIFKLTDKGEGDVATVTISGDLESEALTVCSVLGQGLDVTVASKPVEVAEEEVVKLKKITIEPVVSTFDGTEEIKVKVGKDFQFVGVDAITLGGNNGAAFDVEDNEFKVKPANGSTAITIENLYLEAVTAEPGDVATITATCSGLTSDSDEAAVVIGAAVVMSVDEDEDVPVFYSGVDKDDTGLTSDDDHLALEVTIEEAVYDSWDFKKAWNLELPEGVYVTNVTPGTCENVDFQKFVTGEDSLVGMFKKAYQDGDYEGFEFGRRAFDAVNDQKEMKMVFTLEVVAEPDFEGDVTLKLTGDAFEEAQEVVIAKFVKAVTVEAAQNDLVIDYKETIVPTSVVIKEAEEGLWNDTVTNTNVKAAFALAVEDIGMEDATIEVDEDESGMEIDVDDATFVVDEESDDAAANVTVSEIELMMWRDIPAGAYDLEMNTAMYENYLAENVFAGKVGSMTIADLKDVNTIAGATYTVKEGFVNVITAGRDQDDASFTTKVVVPVGATEIVAGEDVVALDVPAYINAAGYTMLPVRAVSVALGIHTNNVIWDQATKTVTILYGQRIITMTVGSKVINVNGSAIPASAAVEIVNGRTFLGLRDLATALGVTDITWDAATQTATLNGNK